MNKHEDIFKSALSEIKKEELVNLPSEDEIDYKFSRTFEENQKELINLQNRKKKNKNILKRITIVAIAATLLLITMLYAAADRDRPFEFLYRLYDQQLVLDIEGDDVATDVEVIYKLAYLPDGFVEVFRTHSPYVSSYSTIYKKPELREISLHQCSKNSAMEAHLSTYLTLEEIAINSIDVIYVHDDSLSLCYWTNEKYIFELSFPSELGKEYLEKNVGKLVVDYVVYPEENTVPEVTESYIYP